MSKNFELLRSLGKEQEFLNKPSTRDQWTPAPSMASVDASSTPTLTPNLAPTSLEQMNALVQQVFIASGAEAPRTVVMASAEPQTGCTWVTAHVGEIFATRVGGTVCLLDANLRDPSLHQQFNIDNPIGISDALLQLDPIRAYARQLSLPNLFIISAGSVPEQAKSLVGSDRMRLRINELRSEFDYVLIDACALSVANDAIALGSFADGVLLVLKANASRKESAKQAVHDLQEGKAKVLGAVLNQRSYPIPDKIYNQF